MKITNLILAIVCSSTTAITASSENKKEHYLSMIGSSFLQYHPTFFVDVQSVMKAAREVNLNKTTNERTRKLGKRSSKTSKSPKAPESPSSNNCDPADVQLLDYPQWEAERGYWIGKYTLMQGNGKPFVSGSWNYPYDHYKGFITGEVVGNSYRQRNVFLYPPQVASMCGVENAVVGNGECGTNGNTKVFNADQSATTCSTNEELGGDIVGPYIQGPYVLPTKTELVGQDNALLYQVFIPGAIVGKEENILMQSQLTTITEGPDGQIYRTRTAQSFDTLINVGVTTSASYYRERKVNKTEFYAALENSIAEYNIRVEDLCVWDSNSNAIAGVTGSLETCEDHLEQSFALENDLTHENKMLSEEFHIT